jgi:hypothetical protein
MASEIVQERKQMFSLMTVKDRKVASGIPN